MSTTDEATPASPYVSPTERVIFDAAANLLTDVSERVALRAYSPETASTEVLNIGGLRARLDVAAEAIRRALVALDVNAEHYRDGAAYSTEGAKQAGELAGRHLASVEPEAAS
jgi:hypothetical protein